MHKEFKIELLGLIEKYKDQLPDQLVFSCIDDRLKVKYSLSFSKYDNGSLVNKNNSHRDKEGTETWKHTITTAEV